MKRSRLGPCEVCKKEEAKYTCPACEVTSCSLQCSKKHKRDNDCDGIRQRTSFVRLAKLDDLHLTSDYRLMEDISRKVDSCQRDKTLSSTRVHNQIPAHLHKLKMAVVSRGCHLMLLPHQFSRRRANTTKYNWKTQEISWKIQLTFLHANNFTLYENRCPEGEILRTVLDKYLNNSDISPKIAKKLEVYRKAGLDSVGVLMKAEKVAMSDKKFYKLDMDQSLKANFVGKTVVEFPQLYICIDGFTTTRKAPPEPEESKIEMFNKKQKSLLVSDVTKKPHETFSHDEPEREVLDGSSSSSFGSGDEDDCDFDMEAGEVSNYYKDLVKL